MNIRILLNPLFLIPTGAVALLDMFSVLFFFRFFRKGNLNYVKYLLLSKPILTAICIFFSISQFYMIGGLYLLLAPAVALLMLIIGIIQFVKLRSELGYPSGKYYLNMVWCLILIISISVPSF